MKLTFPLHFEVAFGEGIPTPNATSKWNENSYSIFEVALWSRNSHSKRNLQMEWEFRLQFEVAFGLGIATPNATSKWNGSSP